MSPLLVARTAPGVHQPQAGYEIYQWWTSETISWKVEVTTFIELDSQTMYWQDPSDIVYSSNYNYTGTDNVPTVADFGDRVGGVVASALGGAGVVAAASFFASTAAGWAAASYPTMAAGAGLGAIGAALTTPAGFTALGIVGAW
jgi:hypothetical protein